MPQQLWLNAGHANLQRRQGTRLHMRIPLTKYALRELILGSALCLGTGALCIWLYPLAAVAPALAWLLLIAFFRDPNRPATGSDGEFLSPADGEVVDIEQVDSPAFLDGPAIRIGIFMSLFNVHVNRAPMAGTVRYVEHFPGRFHNARKDVSSTKNEHTLIGFETANGCKILVNQIAGVIARRVVCAVKAGDSLERGQRLGMVKFGSRVELFVPTSDSPVVKTRVGDKVRGARDVLVACEQPASEN